MRRDFDYGRAPERLWRDAVSYASALDFVTALDEQIEETKAACEVSTRGCRVTKQERRYWESAIRRLRWSRKVALVFLAQQHGCRDALREARGRVMS